jgi:hypothetical protein
MASTGKNPRSKVVAIKASSLPHYIKAAVRTQVIISACDDVTATLKTRMRNDMQDGDQVETLEVG